MEAERVKTKKVSAADRIPEKTGRKKWSVLFLESLLKEAKERGLENLKGYRTVGGMRASIYNAMPMDGVIALVDFMREFERRNG